MNLEKLLKQPNALPSAPKVVRKLMNTFSQDDVDPLYAASQIEDDPVMTAKLLKTANSAFFGLTRNVSNARDAIHVLGLIKVRALVIAASLEDAFHCLGGVNLNQFWRYSLNSANMSRAIALPIRIDEDTAFTAGLVHGIGELIMHAAMPEAMLDLERSIPMLDLKRARAEQGIFGYSYAEVGAALAKEWRFPKKMVDAIRRQIKPFENDVYEPIAGVIHVASWRARAQELALSSDDLINSYPEPIGLVLGIDPDSVIGDALPSISRDIEAAAAD